MLHEVIKNEGDMSYISKVIFTGVTTWKGGDFNQDI